MTRSHRFLNRHLSGSWTIGIGMSGSIRTARQIGYYIVTSRSYWSVRWMIFNLRSIWSSTRLSFIRAESADKRQDYLSEIE